MKRLFFGIFLVSLSVLFRDCRSKGPYTQKPSKSLVNPDNDLVEVNAVALHVNDSASVIFVEAVNENLVYKRPDTTQAFYAEIRIIVKLRPERGSRKLLDSSSFRVYDRAEEPLKVRALRSIFNVKAKSGQDYFCEIDVIDLNKRTSYSKGFDLLRKKSTGEQYYLVSSKNGLSFSKRFSAGDTVNIETGYRNVNSVSVDMFKKEFAPALPPFVTRTPDEMKYLPDSTFTMQVNNGAFQLTMPEKGFYHIRTDISEKEGLSLYSFGSSFPGVSNTEEMIQCTRYIMSKEEFTTCMNADDRKQAIDRFWQTIGGSNERAKELLKRYYGRVKEANKYYTSFLPGWKSDRGMIFIVYGKPTSVYKGNRTETWVYGPEPHPNTVRYTFIKTENPFSDNDYILERSQFFKDHWYQAVDVWRQGHVYLNKEN